MLGPLIAVDAVAGVGVGGTAAGVVGANNVVVCNDVVVVAVVVVVIMMPQVFFPSGDKRQPLCLPRSCPIYTVFAAFLHSANFIIFVREWHGKKNTKTFLSLSLCSFVFFCVVVVFCFVD